jgi:lambda family phage portal protein
MHESPANASAVSLAKILTPSRMETTIDNILAPFAPGLVARRLQARAQAGATRAMLSYAAAYPSLQREQAFGPLVTEEAELPGFSRFQLILEGRDLYRNMPIIRAGVNGVARRAVGTGIRLQLNTEDDAWNHEALSQWNDWCEEVDVSGNYDLQGLCRQAIRSAYTDGDLGIGLIDQDGDLKVQLVEGDRIAEEMRAGIQIDRNNPIGGVEVDWETGRPISFLVGRRNAGGVLEKVEPWNAESFLLFYRRQRVDQVRGVPLLAPVIQTARDLDKYLTATRIAANVQATFGVFIKRQNPAQLMLNQSSAVSGTNDYRTQPMKTGQIWHLAPDEDVTGFTPTMPASQFDDVAKFWVRLIAVGMGSTYEMIMSDFGDMSFSASRVQLMEHDAINKEWQRLLVQRVLNRLYRVWVSKRMETKLLAFNPQAYDKAQWIGPASESVDPVGDSQSHIELINNKLMSRQRYYTQLGLEWKAEQAQIKREEEWQKEQGMVPVNAETEPGAEKPVDEPAQVEEETPQEQPQEQE